MGVWTNNPTEVASYKSELFNHSKNVTGRTKRTEVVKITTEKWIRYEKRNMLFKLKTRISLKV